MDATTVKDELEALLSAARAAAKPPLVQQPATLYHFTDAPGAIGIVTSTSLRASHAECLNDASEMRYGIDVIAEALRERVVSAASETAREFCRVAHLYVTKQGPRATYRSVDADPFVVSFCTTADRAAQWLHYGRSGTGYALGFETARLACEPFELAKVIYDSAEQRTTILAAIEHFERALHGMLTGRDLQAKRALTEAAAYVAAKSFLAIAARFKHDAFRDEEELRLVTFRVHGATVPDGGSKNPTVEFLSTGNRIVPYVTLKYSNDGFPLTSVLLGARADHATAETSLRLMLQQAQFRGSVEIQRSSVAVR
jgi:Protein of unknown function (DUF2971)